MANDRDEKPRTSDENREARASEEERGKWLDSLLDRFEGGDDALVAGNDEATRVEAAPPGDEGIDDEEILTIDDAEVVSDAPPPLPPAGSEPTGEHEVTHPGEHEVTHPGEHEVTHPGNYDGETRPGDLYGFALANVDTGVHPADDLDDGLIGRPEDDPTVDRGDEPTVVAPEIELPSPAELHGGLDEPLGALALAASMVSNDRDLVAAEDTESLPLELGPEDTTMVQDDGAGEDASGEDESGEDESGEDESGEDESGEDESGEDASGEDESGEDEGGEDDGAGNEALEEERSSGSYGEPEADDREHPEPVAVDSDEMHEDADERTGSERGEEAGTGGDEFEDFEQAAELEEAEKAEKAETLEEDVDPETMIEPAVSAPTSLSALQPEAAEPSPLERALEVLKSEAPAKLEAFLVAEFEAASDESSRAALSYELALLRRQQDDEVGAMQALGNALRAEPSFLPAHLAMRSALVAGEQWAEVIKLLDARVRVEEAPRRKAELLLEKACLLEDRLGQPGEAKECYWAAHVADKSWLAPLIALEGLLAREGDLAGLADVYQRTVDGADDPTTKVAALRDLSRLQTKIAGGTPDRALELLEQATELVADGPERRALLAQMGLVATQAALRPQRVAILERMAGDEDLDALARAALLREASHIIRYELDDAPRAKALLDRAFELCPEEPALRHERLALAEKNEDWALLTEMLQSRLEGVSDPTERAALSFQIAMAQGRAGDSEGATASLDSALEILPGYMPALVEREREALAAGDLESLLSALTAESSAIEAGAPGLPRGAKQDRSWEALTQYRIAVALRGLGRLEEALEACRRAVDACAAPELMRGELRDLLGMLGRHADLAASLEQSLEDQAGDEQRRWTLETLAALYGGPLEDLDSLLRTLARIAEAGPPDARLLARRAEVLERKGDLSGLEDTLKELEELPGQSAEEITAARLRRAALYAGPLNRADDAVATYREILEAAPEEPYAFAAIEALLHREGKHEELAAVLRRAAEQCEDASQRGQLLYRLGRIEAADLADPAKAYDTYGEMLAQSPDDQAALHALWRVARAGGEQRTIADALEAQRARAKDPAHQARLSLWLAEVLQYGLQEGAQAEEAYNAVIRAVEGMSDEAEAAGARMSGPAREALFGRQLARGDFLEADGTLDELGKQAPAEVMPMLLRQRAWIASGPMGDSAAAERHYQALAELVPQDAQRVWARQREAVGQRTAAALAGSTIACAELVDEPAIKASMQARAGTFAAVTAEASGALFRATLESDPGALEAMLGLLASGDVTADERVATLEQFAGQLKQPQQQQLELALAEARIAAGQLSEAAEVLRPTLEQRPDDVPALALWLQLTRAAGAELHEARAWVRLASLLDEAAPRVMALREGGELLEELGRRRGGEEGQRYLSQAALAYRQALALKPGDGQIFERLRRLYKETSNHEGLEQLHSLQIAETHEDRPLLRLLLERAELRLQKLDDVRGAAKDLRRVLAMEPKHLDALRQLAELYDADGDVPQATELYKRFAELAETVSAKRAPMLRLAELLARHRRVGDAIEVCRRFLELVPEDDTVLEKLAELYVEIGDHGHAVQTLERLGGLRSDREWRVENKRRIAKIYWDKMQDLQGARTTLLSTQDIDPTNLEVLDDLRRLSLAMSLAPEDLHQLMERAKDDVRDVLSGAPLDVELYRKLMRVAEWDEDEYTLLASLGVLCYLNAASEQDRDLYGRRVAKLSFEPKRNLALQAWREALQSGQARSAYGEIWSVIAPAVPKLFPGKVPSDVKAFGLGRGDRVSRKAGGPVSSTVDRIAAAFGMGDFEIYLSRKEPDRIIGVAGDKDALVVGHAVVTSMDAAQRFRVGRTLSMLRHKGCALEQLDGPSIALLLGAAVYIVEPGATLDVPRQEVATMAKRLNKAMSRKARKALPLAITRYLQEGGDVDGWLNGVLATANRAGLLVCGDILTAMAQLDDLPSAEERAKLTSERLVELLRDSQQAPELLRFSISEQYLSLRRDLQL